MKKLSIIFLCICLNIIFALMLIHKQNKIIGLLYTIQILEKEKASIAEEKKSLLFKLHKHQDLKQVQTFAKDELSMKKVTIKDAKKVPLKQQEEQ